VANGMDRTLRPRRHSPAGPTPSKTGQFDMAAHRKWFGEVCGANGKAIAAMIRGETR